MSFTHWLRLINRGVCLPLKKTQVNDDRWYTKPAPLFLPKGHYWYQPAPTQVDCGLSTLSLATQQNFDCNVVLTQMKSNSHYCKYILGVSLLNSVYIYVYIYNYYWIVRAHFHHLLSWKTSNRISLPEPRHLFAGCVPSVEPGSSRRWPPGSEVHTAATSIRSWNWSQSY